MKLPFIALAAGFAALTAATTAPTSAEARSTERATMNRLDPNRITSKRVQRHDYAGGHRYRWHDGDDRRWRRYNRWHRYDSRPYGWRNRGCVAIGPVWFCP